MRTPLLSTLGISLMFGLLACSVNAPEAPEFSRGDFTNVELEIDPLPDFVAGQTMTLLSAEARLVDRDTRAVRDDANGELILDLLNPDFDGQLLGSRTFPLRNGVAILEDLGVSAAGLGYRLFGLWEGIGGFSPEFNVQSASDVVRIDGALGPVGVLAQGSMSRGSIEQRMVLSEGAVVEVGALMDPSAFRVDQSFVVAFPLDGRPPAEVAGGLWTPGVDEVEVQFGDPVTIDLAFWIVHGDPAHIQPDIDAELANIREIFATENTGLLLGDPEIIDARANPFADELQNRPYFPGYRDSVMTRIGSRPDRINFYVLNRFVFGDQATIGVSLGPDFAVITQRTLKRNEGWVAHFLGHSLGLADVDPGTGFDTLNVMSRTFNARSTLSEGQILHMFAGGAVVQLFGRTPLSGGDVPMALRFAPDAALPVTRGVRRSAGSPAPAGSTPPP